MGKGLRLGKGNCVQESIGHRINGFHGYRKILTIKNGKFFSYQ